jgi:class 3 adenylate cyclase
MKMSAYREPSSTRIIAHCSQNRLEQGNGRSAETSPLRRLSAVLVADVAGYSRLMGRNEEGTLND